MPAGENTRTSKFLFPAIPAVIISKESLKNTDNIGIKMPQVVFAKTMRKMKYLHG